MEWTADFKEGNAKTQKFYCQKRVSLTSTGSNTSSSIKVFVFVHDDEMRKGVNVYLIQMEGYMSSN